MLAAVGVARRSRSISAPCSGSPLTYQRPFSQARSSGRVSSIVEAISRALSRTLRETIGDRRPGDGRRARAVGAEAVRRAVGVAVADLDVLGRDPELLGHDLGERRLVALALGLGADRDHRLARRVDAQVGAVVHRQPEDVHVLARAGADALGEERDADPHQLAAGPLLGLLAAQVLVAGDLHRDLHRLGVVAGVIRPAGRRLIRELLGRDEALASAARSGRRPSRARARRPSARPGTRPR